MRIEREQEITEMIGVEEEVRVHPKHIRCNSATGRIGAGQGLVFELGVIRSNGVAPKYPK